MACPFFKPVAIAVRLQVVNGRLPLIDRYEGCCLATNFKTSVPVEARLDYCNHGYSRGSCEHFPAHETRSALRYTVLRHSPDVLEILCIEEQDHAPLHHYQLRYQIAESALSTPTSNEAVQAQAIAFCRSYLTHFGVVT